MKAHFVTLTALSVLLSASEAPAQMTVDVAKITCRQYLFDRTFSPRADDRKLAQWLFQWAEEQHRGGSRRHGQEQGQGRGLLPHESGRDAD